MFHFTSIDDKKRNLVQEISFLGARDTKVQCKRFQTSVQEIQNEGMKSNLKHETLNFIRQTI